jgi:hypothetical protein
MPWSNLRTTQIACVIDLVVYRANHARYVCDHETVEAAPKFVMTSEPDYGQLRPRLGWLSIDAIKKTFERTTQLARMPMSTILKKRYKSPNPALNVHPRDEPVATDTIYSDTPAINCGVTSAQLFVGTKTHTADVYPIKSDKQFVNTLLDNITQRGAPTKLISDRAQVEISERVNRFFDPYTFPLGRVSRISSIRTLLNASTRTSSDCATPSLTALGLQRTLGFFVSCMCDSCSTTHGVKWLMIFLFACPRVLLMTSVPCYVFTSGNLSTTSLMTVTFRLTHVRNADISLVSASLSDMP